MSTPPVSLIQFDDWTLDTASGELTRRGTKILLQEQSLQVLQALLQRPGQIVTREELIARLWPNRIVDFDAGLNAVIRRLRAALQDESDSPRYIETLPRRGYRFIGRVEARHAQTDPELRTEQIGATEPQRAGSACLVVIHAPHQSELSRRHVLAGESMSIGRSHDNDIVLPSQSVSRKHVRIERRGGQLWIVDDASTNGTFLNYAAEPLQEERLNAGDEVRLGDWILKCLCGRDVDAQYHELIHQLTLIDGLTGLLNRRHFDAKVGAEIQRAQRHRRPLSLLLVDIDRLLIINDRYGHLAGDTVLRGLAAIMRTRARPQDTLGRYAGEEFCALMPETELAAASIAAESLRSLVMTSKFAVGRRWIHATVSTAAASLETGMQLADLYRAAEEKLIDAKQATRGADRRADRL
jgi:diguanylate cyclase (GGDEF)-like protein